MGCPVGGCLVLRRGAGGPSWPQVGAAAGSSFLGAARHQAPAARRQLHALASPASGQNSALSADPGASAPPLLSQKPRWPRFAIREANIGRRSQR